MFEYEFRIDTDRRGNFGSELDVVSDYVIDCSWGHGLNSAWEQVATSAYLRLTLDNSDGRFSLTDPSAVYYGKMTHGTLVRVRGTNNGLTTTFAILKIKDFKYLSDSGLSGDGSEYRLQVICECPMKSFLSLDFVPDLQFDVRINHALAEIFSQETFIYPYDGAYFFIGSSVIGGGDFIYDYASDLFGFEQSYAVLPFAGDNLDRGKGAKVQTYIRDLMKAEFTGFFFWDIRSEIFRFFNRHHAQIKQFTPFIGRYPSHTFTMADFSAIKSAYGEDLYNEVSVHYYPRSIGTPGSIISSSTAVPMRLPALATRTIRLRYRDPDNDSVKVGAQDVIAPVMGFDIIANSEEDGSGVNKSGSVGMRIVSIGAEQAEIVLTNGEIEDTIYLTKIRIRGTPINADSKETITVREGFSQQLYDRSVMPPETCRLIADALTATEYANYLLRLHRLPDLFFKSVVLNAKDFAIRGQIQTRVIGDVITITDSHGSDKNYMIVGERHTLQLEIGSHTVEWILRPTAHGGIFVIGTSVIGGNDYIFG